MVVSGSNPEAAQGLSEQGFGKIDWIKRIEIRQIILIYPNLLSDKKWRVDRTVL